MTTSRSLRPRDLESTLVRIVEEIGPPTGPSRAIAVEVLEEWQAACVNPEFVTYLLGKAALQSHEEPRRGR
jgi:hypothetical protein